MTQAERNKQKEWEALVADVNSATTIDDTKSARDVALHRQYLEAHPIEWIKFFFPKYAKYEFAPFHVKAINRLLGNDEWYEVWSWSRELAKSTVAMFCIMYLTLTGRKHTVVLCSSTLDSAEKLLRPYRANFEANRRIEQYYGVQQSIGEWTDVAFKTRQGTMFVACGAGQTPRGLRNESIRPDILAVDDYDTDQDCQNPDIIDKKWDWWEKALYPTRAVSEPTTVLFCGNIIAEDCCVVRAGAAADHWDVINIRMVDIRHPNPNDDFAAGVSVWPNKNSEEMIDRVLSKISTRAAMGEYFNCPIVEGKLLANIKFGKVPSLRKFPFLVIYGDPTQSEAKGTAKNKKGSLKAVWLLGKLGDVLYVIKGYLGKMTSAEFIDCFFALYKYAGCGTVPTYLYLENNSLQDPFFNQVFKPHMAQKRAETGIDITITPDEEKKADKAVRIEANLEPIVREGRLVLNEAEREDAGMKSLSEEFRYFTMALKFHADGIDAVEGGNRIINNKHILLAPSVSIQKTAFRKFNKNRL